MQKRQMPFILVVDDDPVSLKLTEHILHSSQYKVLTVTSGYKALLGLQKEKPDLILLDIVMPDMDGYEVCSHLQADKSTAYIPVVFLSSRKEEQDIAKAFAVGATDYLTKPVERAALLQTIEKFVSKKPQWNDLSSKTSAWENALPSHFIQFKNFLSKQLNLLHEDKMSLEHVKISDIYSAAAELDIKSLTLAEYMAQFTGLDLIPAIRSEDILLGKLPTPFCRTHSLIALKNDGEKIKIALSNPFDWELLDLLKSTFNKEPYELAVIDPEVVASLFPQESTQPSAKPEREIPVEHKIVEQERPAADYRIKLSKEKIADHPIITIANSLIDSAAKERASDIHIEPKEQRTVIRFRIDGDMREMFTLKNKTGVMIISRLKILANMDIAEKRKPQDGAFAVVVGNTTYSLRLATTPTVYGESLIIRLLDPYARPKDLTELGMTEKQSNDLNHLVGHNQGLILIVGPTGSGKTTTIYSLLHKIDYKTRSIISVEDPVEYRISFVNQQQVGGRGGATFENLLKSVVRQDPDVLFLGEIRDAFSAKMAINFASTGHFSISTLHTTNATTALFRLERLEVDRLTMATSLIGIVAQKLLKKLCPHCKKIVPISEDERRMLSAFADEIPSEVAHPVGCSRCNNTGYSGREGIYEIITIDPAIEEMIRANAPIAKIREFIMGRGDYLISNHAFEKVKSLITSPRDAYEAVLIEEVDSGTPEAEMPAPGPVFPAPGAEDKTKILIVEDEPVTRKMLARILEKDGYIVAAASDGIDALLRMGKEKFHLILSDIDMPNLDGLRLLDLKNQKGIDAPVIFLTSKNRPEDERQGYLLGAVDYIKKPFEREPLLKKIQYALKKERENCE